MLVSAQAQMKPDTAYMEVPRCKSCRWWGDQHAERALCLKLVTIGWDTEGLAPDSATVGGLRVEGVATIMTGPDFGCVQWEPKP